MELIRHIARTVKWHRRLAASVLAALAVLALAVHLRPAPTDVADVVVTTREVAAGDVLQSADLALVQFPVTAVPDTPPLATDDVLGHTAAVRIAAGTALQPGLLVIDSGAASGRARVPIMVDTPILRLLVPGTAVTLVNADGSADVVTNDSLVAAMPEEESRSPLSPGMARPALVLLDVPAELAPTVSVLGQHGQLSVILGGL